MCTSSSDQKHPELHNKEMSVHDWPLNSSSHNFRETLCFVCSQHKTCAVRQYLLILAHALYHIIRSEFEYQPEVHAAHVLFVYLYRTYTTLGSKTVT